MERGPAFVGRWQESAAAQRPRPHPEMTTVWPSSRTLPTWKTDGLRLLLTEPPLDGPISEIGTCGVTNWVSAGHRGLWIDSDGKSSDGGRSSVAVPEPSVITR